MKEHNIFVSNFDLNFKNFK